MTGKVEAKLVELGITLPGAPTPAGNYLPFTVAGGLVFVSGQLPLVKGALNHKGLLGRDLSVEDGYQAARICALNLLALLKAAAGGDLDRIAGIVRVGGFVASAPDFTDQAKVVNGASDLFAQVFGEAGKHARAAVGVVGLPLGAAVEVEVIAALAK